MSHTAVPPSTGPPRGPRPAPQARSPRYGWYYDALVPGEHYLTFMNTSDDDVLEVGCGV